jgi:DNA-binding response OmpR family regulator
MFVQRVLVADEDRNRAAVVGCTLKNLGYYANLAYDLDSATESALHVDYAAAICDVGLPQGSGYSLPRNLRTYGVPTPVILHSDRAKDRILSLKWDANYFLARPLDNTILIAAMEMLIRDRRFYKARIKPRSRTVRVGSLFLDYDNRYFETPFGRSYLTAVEADIMRCLMSRAPNPVPRDHIMDEVWSPGADITENALCAHMMRLRKKIEKPPNPKVIVTRARHGFSIQPVEPSHVPGQVTPSKLAVPRLVLTTRQRADSSGFGFALGDRAR